jgi:hypothetical protein
MEESDIQLQMSINLQQRKNQEKVHSRTLNPLKSPLVHAPLKN